MNAARVGRLFRILRLRNRVTQSQLAGRARVTRRVVSLVERGLGSAVRLGDLEALAAALDAHLDLRLQWHGPELDRLLDAGHAALAASVKRRLERRGWLVRVEVSYSRYGERGRIDLLAWHPVSRALLVIELKTQLVDVGALIGSVDVKARLARHVAASLGWEVAFVVPAIVFAENRTTRRRLEHMATLFDGFGIRGRAAFTWMRHPVSPPPSGLLGFLSVPGGAVSGVQRVRPRRSRQLLRGRATAAPAGHLSPDTSVAAGA